MSNVHVLYINNDSVLQVEALRDEIAGTFLNGATVNVTLRDAFGASVTGGTWPIQMAYVTGSDGTYRATLPYTLALAVNGRYTAVVTVDAGLGLHAEWAEECVARAQR